MITALYQMAKIVHSLPPHVLDYQSKKVYNDIVCFTINIITFNVMF